MDDCRVTAGKEELGKEPSYEFKNAILLAEHSPIRDISFKWRWTGIKSWIATHWVRHKWECFVKSQRSDRTGIPRDKLPQDQAVDFVGEANVQHLIDTMRKRLCYQASPETRAYAYDLKMAIQNAESEIGEVLVPNCIYRFGCPEMRCCGKWDAFVKWAATREGTSVSKEPLRVRYALWNEYFYKGEW